MTRRALFIVGFTVLCLGVLAGALRLEVDFSARAFFGSDGDETVVLDRFQKRFGPDDNIVLVVIERAENDLLDQPSVDAIRAMGKAISAIDGVDRVHSFVDLALPTTDEGGSLSFLPAVPLRLSDEPLAHAGLKARLKRDAILTPTFLSDDATKAAIAVFFGERQTDARVDTDDIGAVRKLVAAIETSVDTIDKPAGMTTTFAGMPVVRASLLSLILGDQVRFVPLSFGLMALLLGMLYRRFHGVMLPLFAAALPSALVMGVMGYRDEPIGVVNQVYFTLLPVIAVSGALHLLSRYYDEALSGGVNLDTLLPHRPGDAVIRALGEVGTACFLSAMTTIVGLASLTLSSMPILRSFGLYSSVGVAFAFLTLIIPVPLVLTLTKGRVVDAHERTRSISTDGFLEHCADATLSRPKLAVGAAFLVLAAALAIGQTVVVDTSLGGMLKPDHEATLAGRTMDESLGGFVAIELFFESDAGTFADARALKALVDVEKLAKSESDAVRATASLGGLAARMNGALTDDATVPSSNETAAQLLFLADGQQTRRDLVTDNFDATRVQLRVRDLGAVGLAALSTAITEKARAIMTAALPDRTVTLHATGTALTTYAGVGQLASDLKLSLLTAFLFIIALLSVTLRSVRFGILAILPNALPVALGYALLGLMGWPLEPGPAVALCVALGIAVDDTIHLLMSADDGRKRGLLPATAIRQALVRTGRPVIFTTIILAAGFGVNALSSFPTNSRVGVIGAFVIVVALIADLFVLPPLLLLAFGRHKTDAISDDGVRSVDEKT